MLLCLLWYLQTSSVKLRRNQTESFVNNKVVIHNFKLRTVYLSIEDFLKEELLLFSVYIFCHFFKRFSTLGRETPRIHPFLSIR